MKTDYLERKSYPTDLTDEQWTQIEPLFVGMREYKHSKRELTNAVLYLVDSGCKWRQLPHDFPPHFTVHSFYRRARLSGLWDRILQHLVIVSRQKANLDENPTYAVIDSYKYGTDNIGVCKYCEEKFNTHQISDEDFELYRQYGLCPTCAKKYMKFKEMDKAVMIQKFLFEKEKKAPLEVLRAGYKLAFWGLYRRILFKGGHRVGERFRRVFVDAVINNPAFTINMFINFTDCSYCREVLKFGSYPMIIDVTNVSDSEQRYLKEDLYERYGVTRYRVFDRTIRLINQIYEKNLVACIAEFKRLGLIPQDAEY